MRAAELWTKQTTAKVYFLQGVQMACCLSAGMISDRRSWFAWSLRGRNVRGAARSAGYTATMRGAVTVQGTLYGAAGQSGSGGHYRKLCPH
eukprot:8944218-Pyramimonas_sp.AAC.2